MNTATGHFHVSFATIFGCLCLTLATAAERGEAWYKRVWQTDDGLPAANVTGIAQTRDGYLWLATQSGLARFDGAQFEEIPVPVGRARPIIRALLCDHAENLWLAEDGGVVVRLGKNSTQMFTTTNGLPDVFAQQIVETLDHFIWVSYADGSVHCITPDNQVIRQTAANGLNEDGLGSLAVDARGVLWFAKGTQFGFYADGRFQNVGTLPDRNPQILGTRNGSIWFCTSAQLLKLATNGVPEVIVNFAADESPIKPTTMYEDANGHLWIGTAADGLFQFDRTNLFKIETSHNNIRTVTRDREGSVWVGTDGGGLDRLRPQVVRLLGRDEGLPFETVRSLAEDKTGALWIVTQDGALSRSTEADGRNIKRLENWPGGQAHCVTTDRDGTVWVGTYRRGLYRWQAGEFTKFGTAEGLGAASIRSLFVDSRNDLWIGLEDARKIQRLHAGKFQTFDQPADSRAVRTITEDVRGQLWFGTLDGKLLQLADDRLQEIPLPPTQSPHPIRCLAAMADGSLWIGQAVNGIYRLLDGKFAHIGKEDGLFDGNICLLVPDNAGRMWVGSDRGVFFVAVNQLNDFAAKRVPRVQSILFGRDAGLPSLQAYYGYWPGALTTQAGEILFPTHSGIAAIHPERVRGNTVPPNVMIQAVTVDGKRLDDTKTSSVEKLAPSHRRIEIAFTAPSFLAPEQVRFRYRLEGWNDDWSAPQTERVAFFSRLPPGEFTFRVTACNNFGVWNETGATYRFSVEPFFWQSGPLQIFAAVVFTILVVALVRYFSLRRVKLMLKQVEQESALQKERTRIAQDMHDELGARFTQISLLGELSRNAVAEPDKARDFMRQVSRVAQAGVKSLDEIVWAVNPRNDTLADLLDYTGQYALDFLAAASVQCRLDFPESLSARDISGDVRHGVFLIVKEALHNVVKHANASRVKIIFEISEREFCWLIEDDGRGFEQAPDNALADGLRNISQRATALGGSVEIKSRPGAGTRVTLKIPLTK